MHQEFATLDDNTRSYGKYYLAYHDSAHPIGIEKGARITAGLVDGLPEFNVAQYFSTQPTIFVDYDHVITAYDSETDKAIGLLGARWLGNSDVRFLYLWTAMIADASRGTMLFNRIVAYFFEKVAANSADGELPELIVTKTYNPMVYSIFKSFAQASRGGIEVYPQLPAESQDEDMIALAKRIATAISPKLVLLPETGVVLGGQAMVAPDFFPRMEESRDNDVNHHFQTHLTRSDQVLCVLRIGSQMRQAALQMATRGRNPDAQANPKPADVQAKGPVAPG